MFNSSIILAKVLVIMMGAAPSPQQPGDFPIQLTASSGSSQMNKTPKASEQISKHLTKEVSRKLPSQMLKPPHTHASISKDR